MPGRGPSSRHAPTRGAVQPGKGDLVNKSKLKSITLSRETLRNLNPGSLSPAAGAQTPVTILSVCASCQSCHIDCTFRVTCTA
jgi:hypothetical protein